MRNWKKYIGTGCIAISAHFAGIASASPENGIGVYVGPIVATEDGVASTGLSMGMDALFMINDAWSISPYLLVSAERDSESRTVADGLVGLHLRRWFADWYAGAQFFEHDRIVFDNGNALSSVYGLGFGVLAGFERADGWGIETQADLLEPTHIPGVWRNAIRLHLTYRWR